MHKRNISGRRIALMVTLGLAGAWMAHGCTWNDDLFKSHTNDGVVVECKGICEIPDISTAKACEDANGVWVEASCIDSEGKLVEDAKTEIACGAGESNTNTWIEAKCDISQTDCETAGGTWYPLGIVELGDGRYLKFEDNGQHKCGTYNDIVDNKLEDCSPADIKFVKVTRENGICPGSAQSCVTFSRNLEGEQMTLPHAVCSRCSLGQASCLVDNSWQCVDVMNNPSHCGGCGIDCGGDNFCEQGICASGTKICPLEQIACYCRVDNEDNIVCTEEQQAVSDGFMCFDPSSVVSCGVSGCNSRGEECKSGFLCERIGDVYSCNCPSGFVLVGGECVNKFSSESCGATNTFGGHKCDPEMQACDGNKCQCAKETLECDSKCVFVLKDPAHCGGCRNDCGQYATCQNGKCVCDDGYARCDRMYNLGKCVYSMGLQDYCGAKGECNSTDESSGDYVGDKCLRGVENCVNGECNCLTFSCDEKCINPYTGSETCGATSCVNLGTNCTGIDEKSAGAYCEDSRCVCEPPRRFVNVGDKRGCFFIDSDPNCCGPSCQVCAKGSVCSEGSCQVGCTGGTLQCGARCLDPKVHHVKYDPNNPGTCICDNWCDTDDDPNNGCDGGALETVQNCGTCGKGCEAPFSRCVGGVCQCADGADLCFATEGTPDLCLNLPALNMKSCRECAMGWANVDGNWANGCEVDLSSNPYLCGSLDTNCFNQVQNAELPECKDSKCNYLTCQSAGGWPYGDCDGNRSNGCETPLNSRTHCGTCGNQCLTNQDCKSEASGIRCCYPDGKEALVVNKDLCCAGTKLWKRSAGIVCWVSSKYECAAKEPGGCGWKEVK